MGDGPTIGGNTYIRGKYSLPGGGKNGSFRENRWVGAGRERLREHAFGHFHQLERGQAGKDGDPQILLTPGDPGTWLAFHAGADLEDRGPPLQGIGRLLPDPGDHQGPPGGDAVLGRLVNHHPDLPGLPFSAPLEFHDDGRVRLPLRKDPRGGPPEVFGEIGGDEHLPDPQRRPHLLVISVAAHEIFLRDQREPVERLQRDDQDRQSRREGQETERLAPHGRSPLHDEVVAQDDGHGDRRGHQRPYPGIMVPPGFQPGDPALDIQPVAALLHLLRGLAGFPGVGRRGRFRRQVQFPERLHQPAPVPGDGNGELVAYLLLLLGRPPELHQDDGIEEHERPEQVRRDQHRVPAPDDVGDLVGDRGSQFLLREGRNERGRHVPRRAFSGGGVDQEIVVLHDEYGGEDRQGFHRRPDRRILQAIDLADGFLRLSRLEGMPQDRDEFLEKEHERSDREYHRQPPHHGMGSQHLEFQPPAALDDRPQAEVDRIPTGTDDPKEREQEHRGDDGDEEDPLTNHGVPDVPGLDRDFGDDGSDQRMEERLRHAQAGGGMDDTGQTHGIGFPPPSAFHKRKTITTIFPGGRRT